MSDKQAGTADENTICPMALAGDHVVECGEYGMCRWCPLDLIVLVEELNARVRYLTGKVGDGR